MEGLIRKIVIGKEPKDGMAYYIGMRAGRGAFPPSWMMTIIFRFGKEKIFNLHRETMDAVEVNRLHALATV